MPSNVSIRHLQLQRVGWMLMLLKAARVNIEIHIELFKVRIGWL
jgi:hypothetical protein